MTATPLAPSRRPAPAELLGVVHAATGNLYGGVETFLRTLARHRDAATALDPSFALVFDARAAAELREAGARVDVLGDVRFSRPWTVWKARRRFARLLASRPPGVVVSHGGWVHALLAPAARRAGWRSVLWLHDAVNLKHWVERTAARTPPDLIIANSRYTARGVPAGFPGVPCEVLYYPVELIPPPGDKAEIRRAVRAELRTPADDAVIVAACRLERWKGQSLLLDALARLRDVPGWTAWIAGGPQRPHEQVYFDELRATATAAGLADRVAFLGQRTDVPRLLAAADLHCQPNTGPEPFGIAFVEALAAGLPVVSTNIGGAAEIVTEACGDLVPPDDPAALAASLSSLIAHPETRARLGAAGPARAAALCAPTAVIPRFEELLHATARGA